MPKKRKYYYFFKKRSFPNLQLSFYLGNGVTNYEKSIDMLFKVSLKQIGEKIRFNIHLDFFEGVVIA